MTEFTGIKGVAAWRKKLMELLRAAEKAAKGSSGVERRKQAKRLAYFVRYSRPNQEEIRIMDQIAERTSKDLSKQNLDERVASIVSRSAEYLRMEKEMKAQAEANEAAAKALRLESAQRAVITLTDSISVLRELKELVKNESDTSFIERLDSLSDEIKIFRDKLEDEE